MNEARANHLIALIGAASRAIRAQSKGSKEAVPFSFVQLEALRYIKEHGRLLMKDVADYMLITPPSATALIDSLVHMKLIRRYADEYDRRVVRLSLTPRGKRAAVEGERHFRRKFEMILGRLSKKEGDELIKIFEKLSTLKDR